jgi:hypothetical protein
MSYTLELLDEGHIVIVTLGADFDALTEMKASIQERMALMETGPNHIVYITDSRNYYPTKIEDLILAANQVHTPESKLFTQHPKMLKRVTITNNKLGLVAIKGLNTAAFGNLEMSVFATLEEGIEYARKVLAEIVKV